MFNWILNDFRYTVTLYSQKILDSQSPQTGKFLVYVGYYVASSKVMESPIYLLKMCTVLYPYQNFGLVSPGGIIWHHHIMLYS